MANTYQDMTGVLTLEKATPVIKALFKVFDVKPDFPNAGNAFIKEVAECTDRTWPAVIGNLQALAAENGIQVPEADDEAQAGEEVLFALASFYKADDDYDLANYIEQCSFEDNVSISELFFLAKAFDDGHGLKNLQYQGAYHSDKHRLGHFGGYSEFTGAHVTYADSTSTPIDAGSIVEAALDAGDINTAAREVSRQATRFLTGILDHDVRKQVKDAVIKMMQEP